MSLKRFELIQCENQIIQLKSRLLIFSQIYIWLLLNTRGSYETQIRVVESALLCTKSSSRWNSDDSCLNVTLASQAFQS